LLLEKVKMSIIGIDVTELALIANAISLRSVDGAPRRFARGLAADRLAVLSAANVEACKRDCPGMSPDEVPQAFRASEIVAHRAPQPLNIDRAAYSASQSLMSLRGNCDGCYWSAERLRALCDLQSEIMSLLGEALRPQVKS
jgi:hypothetical protein